MTERSALRVLNTGGVTPKRDILKSKLPTSKFRINARPQVLNFEDAHKVRNDLRRSVPTTDKLNRTSNITLPGAISAKPCVSQKSKPLQRNKSVSSSRKLSPQVNSDQVSPVVANISSDVEKNDCSVFMELMATRASVIMLEKSFSGVTKQLDAAKHENIMLNRYHRKIKDELDMRATEAREMQEYLEAEIMMGRESMDVHYNNIEILERKNKELTERLTDTVAELRLKCKDFDELRAQTDICQEVAQKTILSYKLELHDAQQKCIQIASALSPPQDPLDKPSGNLLSLLTSFEVGLQKSHANLSSVRKELDSMSMSVGAEQSMFESRLESERQAREHAEKMRSFVSERMDARNEEILELRQMHDEQNSKIAELEEALVQEREKKMSESAETLRNEVIVLENQKAMIQAKLNEKELEVQGYQEAFLCKELDKSELLVTIQEKQTKINSLNKRLAEWHDKSICFEIKVKDRVKILNENRNRAEMEVEALEEYISDIREVLAPYMPHFDQSNPVIAQFFSVQIK